MTITQSGGIGYRDSDEIRIRPQPWRDGDDQQIGSLAGANAGPATPSLTLPTNQTEFEAVMAQVYADMRAMMQLQ